MQLVGIISTLVIAYTAYCVAKFLQTYRTARKIGFPICLVPVNFHSLLWRLLSVPLRPVFQKHLPADLSFRLEISTYGSEFVLRDRVVQKYGSTVVLCGIGALQVLSADAAIINSVLAQPKNFPPAPISQKIMEVCGRNMISTVGNDWRRQRSIVAPLINEKISSATWDETLSQVGMMLNAYTKAGPQGTSSSIPGLKSLAFNVLGAVGYGKPQEWVDPELPVANGQTGDFVDVLRNLVDYLVIAALIPAKLLLLPVMPPFIRQVGTSVTTFPKLADGLVAEERQSRSTSNNLMSTIVKLVDDTKDGSKVYLSKEEISGNLFLFTLAGYDTTANTMGSALVLLAMYPKWQTWLQEEIDQVAHGNHEYSTSFPQLKRTLAFMFETLRIYTPLLHAMRQNNLADTLVCSEGKSHPIPAGTELQLSFTIIHCHPEYWGQDALEFKPDRWINIDGDLLEPAKGTFVPWSSGPRNCPGMKMAQVEFVGAFYAILRHCTIEPVLHDGENLERARQRLNEVLWDSLPLITLQMQQPEKVELKWIRRN